MQRVSNWLAWGVVAIVTALAIMNWHTLVTPAPVELLVARIEAPLGVLMLGLTAVLVGLFFLATLSNQIGSLLETRKLQKEVQRLQSLIDQAEASRIKALHELIATEFRLLNDRVAGLQRVRDDIPARQP